MFDSAFKRITPISSIPLSTFRLLEKSVGLWCIFYPDFRTLRCAALRELHTEILIWPGVLSGSFGEGSSSDMGGYISQVLGAGFGFQFCRMSCK